MWARAGPQDVVVHLPCTARVLAASFGWQPHAQSATRKPAPQPSHRPPNALRFAVPRRAWTLALNSRSLAQAACLRRHGTVTFRFRATASSPTTCAEARSAGSCPHARCRRPPPAAVLLFLVRDRTPLGAAREGRVGRLDGSVHGEAAPSRLGPTAGSWPPRRRRDSRRSGPTMASCVWRRELERDAASQRRRSAATACTCRSPTVASWRCAPTTARSLWERRLPERPTTSSCSDRNSSSDRTTTTCTA